MVKDRLDDSRENPSGGCLLLTQEGWEARKRQRRGSGASGSGGTSGGGRGRGAGGNRGREPVQPQQQGRPARGPGNEGDRDILS